MLSERLREGIRGAMEEYGTLGPKDRISFLAVQVGTEWGIDWAKVAVDVTPYRKKKAQYRWILDIHTVWEYIDWEKSRIYYYPTERKKLEKEYGREVLRVEWAPM